MRSPGESEGAGRLTSSAPSANFASSVRAVDRREPGQLDEVVERGRRRRGRAPGQLAEDDRRPDPARAARERQLAGQRANQRRLAGAVRPDDGEALAEVELEVERAEPERAALDDRARELGDQSPPRAAPRRTRAAAATATTASRPRRAARGGASPASPCRGARSCPAVGAAVCRPACAPAERVRLVAAGRRAGSSSGRARRRSPRRPARAGRGPASRAAS